MLFQGKFNLNGQMFYLFTSAKNKEIAFRNFIHQLDKKTKLGKSNIYNIFNGNKDNYYIEKGDK